MPKIIELTVEIEIQRVSCPGVWLCQDGRVSLTVYALGSSYQTCLLPPLFPLLFKDVFYFRKRFQESCALNNICCVMKDETIYCELVQWCEDCGGGDCIILAQYLGALNDVLFPPNMCSNDGVDLLMRRSKKFPGILSPKIEVATKVRIDEVWNNNHGLHKTSCECEKESVRQKAVCHTAPYHRFKCSSSHHRPRSASRSRSRTRSAASKSCCTFEPKEEEVTCECPVQEKRRQSPCRRPRCPEYNVYNVKMNNAAWVNNVCHGSSDDEARHYESDRFPVPNEGLLKKRMVESRFIEEEEEPEVDEGSRNKVLFPKVAPCICEICRRYHELFHTAD